jgi:Flp pilus assembly protein TadD
VASLELSAGNFEAALTQAERAAALDPRSSLASRRLAGALLSLRRYPEAEIAQRRAESLSPTDLTLIHQGAQLALAQGDRARAERIARYAAAGGGPMEAGLLLRPI